MAGLGRAVLSGRLGDVCQAPAPRALPTSLLAHSPSKPNTASFPSLGRPPAQTAEERELSALLQTALEGAANLDSFPKATADVYCLVRGACWRTAWRAVLYCLTGAAPGQVLHTAAPQHAPAVLLASPAA